MNGKTSGKQDGKPVQRELTLKELKSVSGGLWLPIYNTRRKGKKSSG